MAGRISVDAIWSLLDLRDLSLTPSAETSLLRGLAPRGQAFKNLLPPSVTRLDGVRAPYWTALNPVRRQGRSLAS